MICLFSVTFSLSSSPPSLLRFFRSMGSFSLFSSPPSVPRFFRSMGSFSLSRAVSAP